MESNLNLYYIFYTVAECRNISAAAKELYISQPAISKAISKLESNLDTTLFIRNSRGVSLTQEGEYLYKQVKHAFVCIRNGEDRIRKMNELGVGHITIGVSTTLCKFVLLPYLNEYIKKNPHIKIKICCQTSSETIAALENGSIDIGFIGLPEKIKGLGSTPLMEIHDTFVTTKNYLDHLKIREGVTEENLFDRAVFMMLNSENISRKYVEHYLSSRHMELSEIMEVGNMDLLIEFAKIDLGIACVIREFVQKELDSEELIEVSLEEAIPKRDVGFLYHQITLKDNPAVEGFISYIKEHLH
ncbi:MAG: LysR family transcriptional regulator [Lachnospiraceae bacterium]|nr:LysR family transcriptional regulator [Lachnospiraceae bacterium]